MTILGEGGNWIVYENPKNKNEIIKIPKNDLTGNKLGRNIENFILIRDKLDTVEFLTQNTFNESQVLITENLNIGDFVYVSPNSYKTKREIQVAKLDSHFKKSTVDCIEEQKLGDYKIEKIEKLNSFLRDILKSLTIISDENILVEFDSYFFGVKRNMKSSIIVYKIADFDNIYTTDHNCFDDNIEEFTKAFYSFLNYFVEYKNRKKYMNMVNQIKNLT
jgi:hypothetical protein